MFNFINKVQNKVNSVISNDEEIYREVYAAEELILEEANRFLTISPIKDADLKRLENLKRLGFSNTKNVVDSDAIKQKSNMIATIEYFRLTYPMNKFINEESVKRICEKYNLILTGVENYIDTIPVKNQEEIVNFKVKIHDMDTSYYYFKGYDNNEQMSYGLELKIIAPISKLNTKNKTVVGHKLLTNDPIVLQPVRHKSGTRGYLIISSWLVEGEDPKIYTDKDVMNPNMN